MKSDAQHFVERLEKDGKEKTPLKPSENSPRSGWTTAPTPSGTARGGTTSRDYESPVALRPPGFSLLGD